MSLVKTFNIKTQKTRLNTAAIFLLVMVFCSLVQSSLDLRAKTDDASEKIANLTVFLF